MSTDGHGTKCHRNIAENFNRLSRAHERYRQTTDGWAIVYGEREKANEGRDVQNRNAAEDSRMQKSTTEEAVPTMIESSPLSSVNFARFRF